MTSLYPHQILEGLGTQLFIAVGTPENEAQIVSQHLVESSLMGHDSHGVMRIPEYLDLIEQQRVTPGGAITVRQTSSTTSIIDCGGNFGQVGGRAAVEDAVARAVEHQVATVITSNCNHVGRLGAYVQQVAEQGMIAIATCNSPVHGHFVLPHGGRQGRLATNPLAYGIPTDGDPIVADFATSVAPEGKIRYYRNMETPLPDGWILDAKGHPSNDPEDFYGPPRGGILPLGAAAGHKGYALGLLVEILGSALAGSPCDAPDNAGNGLCLVVINPDAFSGQQLFGELASETRRYMKSSPPAPGFEEVLVPGELEFRTLQTRQQEGIPLDAQSRDAILQQAKKLSVDTRTFSQEE